MENCNFQEVLPEKNHHLDSNQSGNLLVDNHLVYSRLADIHLDSLLEPDLKNLYIEEAYSLVVLVAQTDYSKIWEEWADHSVPDRLEQVSG